MAGITIDTLARLLKSTILSPVLTLPLVLLARYSQRGQHLAANHEKVFRGLRQLFWLGLLSRVSETLDRLVANNWTNDKYEWDKEIVVVTGGSDGIGKIVVQLLAERGLKVCVLDIQPLTYEGIFPLFRCPTKLSSLKSRTALKYDFKDGLTLLLASPTVTYFPCDLTSAAAINAAANRIRASIGSPTVLINNAGITRDKDILHLSETDLRLTFAVNTLSHYHLAQQFLPYMVQNNHGMIVTVASTAAYLTAPRMTDYAASKSAALVFHEGLSAELYTLYKAPKVRTVLVAQGYTKTSLFTGFSPGDGFVTYALEPATVAEAIVKQVLSGRSGYVYLPEQSAKLFCVPVKNWPVWMQVGFRKGLLNLTQGLKGRAVKQPSEEEEVEGEAKARVMGESVGSI